MEWCEEMRQIPSHRSCFWLWQKRDQGFRREPCSQFRMCTVVLTKYIRISDLRRTRWTLLWHLIIMVTNLEYYLTSSSCSLHVLSVLKWKWNNRWRTKQTNRLFCILPLWEHQMSHRLKYNITVFRVDILFDLTYSGVDKNQLTPWSRVLLEKLIGSS